MKKYNFTIRVFKDECNNPTLSDLQNITISDITIISKPFKFGGICEHNDNKKKYKYDFKLSRKFSSVAGSNSYPCLHFKGNYIDIEIFNFPRYPAFYQDKYAVINCYNGFGYTDYLNNGFPHQLLYRKIEILNIYFK